MVNAEVLADDLEYADVSGGCLRFAASGQLTCLQQALPLSFVCVCDAQVSVSRRAEQEEQRQIVASWRKERQAHPATPCCCTSECISQISKGQRKERPT